MGDWDAEAIAETLAEDFNQEPITSKPWRICKQTDTHEFWIPGVCGDDEWGGGAKLADVRLIAAAPKLLVACELLMAGDVVKALEQAKTAIELVRAAEPEW